MAFLSKEQTYERNREAVNNLGATVVLKQHGTEIYFKDDAYKLSIGTPAMATGGMGDTLAGMITSFVGQFDSLKDAVTSATSHIVILERNYLSLCMSYHLLV